MISYSELAWTEKIISSPGDYEEETDYLSDLIKKHSYNTPEKLLHFGSGAGFNDFIFKRHFRVTGVDISGDMIRIARDINPEIKYIKDDMRKCRLKSSFDAVIVPDSADYMKTRDDLMKMIKNAHRHLKPGGVFLAVALAGDDFRENNFVYTGSEGNISLTVFENNHLSRTDNEQYRSVIIYLIRNGTGEEIVSETQTLGLFSINSWRTMLGKAGFEISHEDSFSEQYDRFMPEGGEYVQRIFVCRKPG